MNNVKDRLLEKYEILKEGNRYHIKGILGYFDSLELAEQYRMRLPALQEMKDDRK